MTCGGIWWSDITKVQTMRSLGTNIQYERSARPMGSLDRLATSAYCLQADCHCAAWLSWKETFIGTGKRKDIVGPLHCDL